MIESHWRGNPIQTDETGEWFYSDDRTPTVGTDRPCGFCGRERTIDDHDGCLGVLPGVINACCGHGVLTEGYLQFKNGDHVKMIDYRNTLIGKKVRYFPAKSIDTLLVIGRVESLH